MKDNPYIQKIICNIKWIIIIVCFILFAISVKAQPVQTSAQTSTNNMVIGDQIELVYTSTYNPEKARVSMPVLSDTFNRFELIGKAAIDSQYLKEELFVTQKYVITHFDSGAYYIPKATFRVQPLDGKEAYEIASDSILINVNTVAVDTSKPLKPIFDIMAAKAPWWEKPLQYGLIILGLIGLGLIIFFLIKRFAHKKKAAKTKKQRTPWEQAQSDLIALESKKLWELNKEKQHHTTLTDIIRTYIEKTFDIDCFEKTSPEIITSVKKYLQKNKYKKRSEELDKLKWIFTTADLVKFAKGKPQEEEHMQSVTAAKSFISQTSSFIIAKKEAEARTQEN